MSKLKGGLVIELPIGLFIKACDYKIQSYYKGHLNIEAVLIEGTTVEPPY